MKAEANGFINVAERRFQSRPLPRTTNVMMANKRSRTRGVKPSGRSTTAPIGVLFVFFFYVTSIVLEMFPSRVLESTKQQPKLNRRERERIYRGHRSGEWMRKRIREAKSPAKRGRIIISRIRPFSAETRFEILISPAGATLPSKINSVFHFRHIKIPFHKHSCATF